ncbi:hypothetical protein A2318_04620 [Candidatus Uhrbacteria bacterium RIFOXYB2_FULL_45_11]|uniref:Uncharacterized protein n=1 Tax=Candidatus Uhrbacteria bacterium RIFOXYB2_FULL_45_11 TaxID=1802421 RepID=A0A1F7W2J2_9BACT|nr:MAG: hypothetical protein A2318_04620 [Candidatus Uhrbacteria bacterium RIFOXYB2_FULL_45_11]
MKISLVQICLSLFLVFGASEARALCEKPTAIADLAKVGQDGEKAFMDPEGVARLLAFTIRAREHVLPCLQDAITPRDAAAFHRLMALAAFTQKDLVRVRAEFHAARKFEPGYEFPVDVVPQEHRLRTLYDQAASLEDGKLEPVFPPDGGYVTVGGVRGAPRPEKTPVIIQVFDPFNKILETRYLQPGEKLPVWGKNPFGITAKDLGIDNKSAWVTPKTWYISAGVAAVLTGALYGVAMYNKSQFQNTSGHDSSDSDRNLQGYADRANAFGTSSIVTGSLTMVFAGLGLGFQFIPEEKPSRVDRQAGSHE